MKKAILIVLLALFGSMALAVDDRGRWGFSGGDLEDIGATNYAVLPTNTVTANAATVSLADGDFQVLDLQGSTGAVTVTISNPTAVQSWALKIIQGDGADDITWSPVIHCPGGPCVNETISIAEDAVDLLTCIYDGTSHLCTLSQDIKGT